MYFAVRHPSGSQAEDALPYTSPGSSVASYESPPSTPPIPSTSTCIDYHNSPRPSSYFPRRPSSSSPARAPSASEFAWRTAQLVKEALSEDLHVLVLGYEPRPGALQLEGTRDRDGDRSAPDAEDTLEFERVYYSSAKGDVVFTVFVFDTGRFSFEGGGDCTFGFASSSFDKLGGHLFFDQTLPIL